jgi:hypothetical protein
MQAYPRITMGSARMYDAAWWKRVVAVWETVVYNPLLDLETWWLPLLLLAAAGGLLYRNRHRWPASWLWRSRRKPVEDGRDLSV